MKKIRQPDSLVIFLLRPREAYLSLVALCCHVEDPHPGPRGLFTDWAHLFQVSKISSSTLYLLLDCRLKAMMHCRSNWDIYTWQTGQCCRFVRKKEKLDQVWISQHCMTLKQFCRKYQVFFGAQQTDSLFDRRAHTLESKWSGQSENGRYASSERRCPRCLRCQFN